LKLIHLYEERTAKGWSQYDLASAAGVQQPLISWAENGLNISRKNALKMAEALGVDVDELGNPEEEPRVWIRLGDLTPEQIEKFSTSKV
jgi:transcriptional regulator with XRE-family HTH domain